MRRMQDISLICAELERRYLRTVLELIGASTFGETQV